MPSPPKAISISDIQKLNSIYLLKNMFINSLLSWGRMYTTDKCFSLSDLNAFYALFMFQQFHLFNVNFK